MKTKCAVCEKYDGIYAHTIEYHKLLEKIYEKIESLQNRMNEIDRNGGFYFENQYQKYKEYQFELKSLL